MAIDLPPGLWLPAKPAVIRKADAADVRRAARTSHFGMLPGLGAAPIAGMSRGAVTIAYTDKAISGADTTTYSGGTFDSKSLGTAAADRLIVVGISGVAAVGASAVSAVTVAGVSAALVTGAIQAHSVGGAHEQTELWQAAVPTGTTGNIVVTWASARLRCGIGLWAIYGANATRHAAATSTGDPLSTTLDIPAGGVAVGKASITSGGTSFTWTNLTENFDENTESVTYHTGASAAFAAAQSGLTITADDGGTATARVMALASWGPP